VPTPPLDSNYLTCIFIAACTALVLVWFVVALSEFLLLVAFLPTTIWYFVIQPVAIIVLLPEFVDLWSGVGRDAGRGDPIAQGCEVRRGQ
jgi:hypothetical protein